MKDILEGIVSDYLASKDYFCRLNVPYKKKVAGEEKENAYDIDVLAIKKNGVIVGDVKNWIGGIPANYFKTEFTPKTDTDQKKRYPRFKAISDHEVRDAMEQKVKELTGKKAFQYIIYCYKIRDKDKQKIYKFLDDNKIKIGNHRIKIVEFKEIFNETWAKISRNLGPVPETDFEKLIRLLIAKEK